MKTTSVRELLLHTAESTREAEAGGVKRQIFEEMESVWARLAETPDSSEAVEADRNR